MNYINNVIQENYCQIQIYVITDILPRFKLPKEWVKNNRNDFEFDFGATLEEGKYYIQAIYNYDWTEPISKNLEEIKSGEKLMNWIYNNSRKEKIVNKNIKLVWIGNKIS